MCNRIAEFATQMTPSLAEMAGAAITRSRVPRRSESRGDAILDVYDNWKFSHRDKATALGNELFKPATPWDIESAYAAAGLLFDAFAIAMNDSDIWDRRLSPSTIASRIRTAMNLHIEKWITDRGL